MKLRVTALFLLALAAFNVLHAEDKPASEPVPARDVKITLPEGFKTTLFAGEPDVVQPIAFTFDDRGRMWVIECLSYPTWKTSGEGQDRIVILEDTNGDGQFDTRKVFFDRGTNVSGIEVGHGGVWLTATPNLSFIPDANGDDIPDGPVQVKLDGFDLKAKHNVVNSLIWGPDGWLYGCNGILSNAKIGKPGAEEKDRTVMNCGVWRYHTVKESFEAVAHGTTNPWGLDFDDHGEMFITNCVIHHLFHVIPGAHYERMFGQDVAPHSYELIKSCADYIHWAGGPWQEARGGAAHDKTGGGHAHSGAMIYLGTNWPAEYRNRLFTSNIHGRRLNSDKLTQQGSGYATERAPDTAFVQDPWFRGIAVHAGPDGGVYIADWSDDGECHDYEEVGIHRENGRIFKITYGATAKQEKLDLASLSDTDLVQMQLHASDWHVRHARRLLQERAAQSKLSQGSRDLLWKMASSHEDVTRRLRGLWALYSTGGVEEGRLLELFNDSADHVRAWAVRLEFEDGALSPAMQKKLAELAAKDPSPRVRLALASGLQRLPVDQRWAIAEALVAHAEDATDHNLPLMVWYAIEPMVHSNLPRTLQLVSKTKIPKVREFLARRIASK